MAEKFPDVLDALRDLHKQATVERSHNYTGHVIERSIEEIEKLRLRLEKIADPLLLEVPGAGTARALKIINTMAAIARGD